MILAAGFALGPVLAAGFPTVGAVLVAEAVATAVAVVVVIVAVAGSEVLLAASAGVSTADKSVPIWSNFLLAVLLPVMSVGPEYAAAAATPLGRVFSPASVKMDAVAVAVAGFVGKASADGKVAASPGCLPIVASDGPATATATGAGAVVVAAAVGNAGVMCCTAPTGAVMGTDAPLSFAIVPAVSAPALVDNSEGIPTLLTGWCKAIVSFFGAVGGNGTGGATC